MGPNRIEENLAILERAKQSRSMQRAIARDKALQSLVTELISARKRAGVTQADVARLMWTTTSAVSRLESGRCARPTFRTIDKYALAVGCRVEITLRPLR